MPEHLPVALNLSNSNLSYSDYPVSLRPKTLAVLRFLMERPGQIVSAAELRTAVWNGIKISPGVLKNCILELRKTLGDSPHTPQFIETIPRQGYRFIGAVSDQRSAFSDQHPTPDTRHPTPSAIGRDSELAHLHGMLDKALRGERQILFVTGEPGIGKTALVEAFLTQVGAVRPDVWTARGQCIEHYGTGETYLPVLDALVRLSQKPGHERLIGTLFQHAPTWLTHLSALLSHAERERLQQELLQRDLRGVSSERRLQELAEALAALAHEVPLVLVLEDLHWSDYATADLLSFLGRRRKPARLMIIGTYRPADVVVNRHPLKAIQQELRVHWQCQELPLACLSTGAIAEYVLARYGEHQPALVQLLHQRTEGNPLFLVHVLDELEAQGVISCTNGQWTLPSALTDIAVRVPDGLRPLLERQIDRLRPEEHRALQVASVAGMEFSAAAIAAGLEREIPQAEELCEALAHDHYLLQEKGQGTVPDRRQATRYCFAHALYRDVVYYQLPAGWRALVHRRIGSWEETAAGKRFGERAAEFASHFALGRDPRRAVACLRQAGEYALQQFAYREAAAHFTKGLALLKTEPDTPERVQQELELCVALSVPLIEIKGYADPDVQHVYDRARELCKHVQATPELFPVLYGLLRFSAACGYFQTAQRLAEQLLHLAQRTQNLTDSTLALVAHTASGVILSHHGQLGPAQSHLEQSLDLYQPAQHRSLTLVYGEDPGVISFSCLAYTLWCLGYPDQALQVGHQALSLAQQLAHPLNVAGALFSVATLHQLRQEEHAAKEQTATMLELAEEKGLTVWTTRGPLLQGWVLTQQGQHQAGVSQMRESVEALRATGIVLRQPYFLALLAEAYGKAGQPEEGLSVLAEAVTVAHRTGERWYEAELHRLQGELLIQSRVARPASRVSDPSQSRVARPASRVTDPRPPTPDPLFSLNTHHSPLNTLRKAEQCFHKALDIARRQSAKSLELRAGMSLSRLWQHQGRQKEARQLLADIYSWFTEGFDTADLQAARAMLEGVEEHRETA